MNTEDRIKLLAQLSDRLTPADPEWAAAMQKATDTNPWFTTAHIVYATDNIRAGFLNTDALGKWVAGYQLPQSPKLIGLVMAGNIPLVGFHDLLCGFLSGHNLMIKTSSKDDVLIRTVVDMLAEMNSEVAKQITFSDRLNGCDAYIATGSNNTARYFREYFNKYPNMIRSNRTSVALLDGTETDEELTALADDVYQYYGLGCRNVTQVCVPEGYDFARMLELFRCKNEYADLNIYKNNYDYYLAIYLLNRVPYMSNESLLMVENLLPFAAVSVLHYRYYTNREALVAELRQSADIQAIAGHGFLPFGTLQRPSLSDYADGVDTMAFLCSL